MQNFTLDSLIWNYSAKVLGTNSRDMATNGWVDSVWMQINFFQPLLTEFRIESLRWSRQRPRDKISFEPAEAIELKSSDSSFIHLVDISIHRIELFTRVYATTTEDEKVDPKWVTVSSTFPLQNVDSASRSADLHKKNCNPNAILYSFRAVSLYIPIVK